MDKTITARRLEDGSITVFLPQFIAGKFKDYFQIKTGLDLSPDPVTVEGMDGFGFARTEPVDKLMNEVEFFVENWLAEEQITFVRVTEEKDPEQTTWKIDAQAIDAVPRHNGVPGLDPPL